MSPDKSKPESLCSTPSDLSQRDSSAAALSEHAAESQLTVTSMLGCLGFGCLISFTLVLSGAPVLAPLSFLELHWAFLAQAFAIGALSLAFFVSYFRTAWLMRHFQKLLTIVSLLLMPAILNGIVGSAVPAWPVLFSCIVWLLFGFGFAASALYWLILFSQLPSRLSARMITIGAIIGTVLFVLITTQFNVLISAAEMLPLALANSLLALYLSRKIPIRKTSYADECERLPRNIFPSELATGTQGLIFGFTSIIICTLGILPTIIAIAAGVIGVLLALFWVIIRPRYDIDSGVVHRISLPPLILGIIFMPFGGVVGKTICASLIIAALSHNLIMMWAKAAIDSYEFSLHPFKRFSYHQVADWLGFLLGMGFGFFVVAGPSWEPHRMPLVVAVLVVLVVAAFSIYGADEEKTKRSLAELITNTALERREPPASPAYFRTRCEAVAHTYGLTRREQDVLVLLAKGRNAEHIQKELFIGSSTAKTHIYNIYRKLNINNQQKLIDLVDEA